MTEYNFIYITAKDKEEAKKIGSELVKERLAACVNVLNGMESLYWWEDKVQSDNEAVLIAKTKKSLVDRLIEKARSMHSYDCPCIVSLPIDGGNKSFLDWIGKETQ